MSYAPEATKTASSINLSREMEPRTLRGKREETCQDLTPSHMAVTLSHHIHYGSLLIRSLSTLDCRIVLHLFTHGILLQIIESDHDNQPLFGGTTYPEDKLPQAGSNYIIGMNYKCTVIIDGGTSKHYIYTPCLVPKM